MADGENERAKIVSSQLPRNKLDQPIDKYVGERYGKQHIE